MPYVIATAEPSRLNLLPTISPHISISELLRHGATQVNKTVVLELIDRALRNLPGHKRAAERARVTDDQAV
jgi:hypothetical protein